MPINMLSTLVTLQFTTPLPLSQATLTLMLVVLGIIIIGTSFGHLTKTKPNLQQHRWLQTTAVTITLTAVSLVMVPSLFSYLTNPNLQFPTALSISTLIHAATGTTALVTAIIYAFNDLPNKTKKWMHITTLLWTTTLILGIVLFLQANQLI